MSRYSVIKAATDAYIKTNGRQEITGAILNAVMIATIDSLGKFYQFVGNAVPDTDPGVIDQNIAYLASTPGTYTHLGGLSVGAGEFAVLKFDGEWKKELVVIVPSKVSQLENDLGFITNAVSDLVNYYTKTETDTALGNFFTKTEVQTILSNYYDKEEVDSMVTAINRQSYVVSWDGTAEPVVADIPAGVSVTWGGNPYVGTLPASADTINKIYLVSNGAGYDEYITTDNSGYSWVAIGSTNIDLTDYVLQSDFDQLDEEVNGKEQEVATDQPLNANKYFNTQNSRIPTTSNLADSSGTYCARLSVTPGEVYRIYGKGNATTHQLYAMGDSNRYVVEDGTPGVALNTRTEPLDLTIPLGVAVLAVNLYQYDADTDKVQKITTTHIPGLKDDVQDLDTRVTALENAPGLNVVDNLSSTSATDALSANQGRVLNEQINGVTTYNYVDQTIRDNKYFNTTNSRIPAPDMLADATGTSCVYLYVTPGEVYRIYGKGQNTTHQLYAMGDSDRYVVENGTPGESLNTRTTPLDLTIPEGVAILVVNLYQYDSATDKVQKVVPVVSECVNTRLDALEDGEDHSLRLKGKKVMFFGDSITDITYNGKGLPYYFGQLSMATCYKAAISGTRFVQRTTPVDLPTSNAQAYAALDICNMVKAWCEADYTKQDAATAYLGDYSSRVNALRNNPIGSVDIVCIGGGTNDMSNSSPIGEDTDNGFTTLKGSINKMIELLLTANPKIKVYFYSPVVGYHGAGGRTDANWDDNHQFSSGLTKPQYIDIFAARTRANHIPYIDLYWTLGINQVNFSEYYLDSDDHHPYKGLDILASRLYAQVLTLME